MEKDVALGVGELKLSLAAGKAVVSIQVNKDELGGAVSASAQASASVDSLVLVDMLFAEIEAKSPAGVAPIEETVKAIIKNAIAAIQ